VLAIKTDGEPDRNPQYASVQLACTALAVLLRIPKLEVMRTAAGQSFTNPVERVMSVINLGLQGVTTARGRCEPETEAVLQNCNSIKDIRKALQQADGATAGQEGSHTQRFAASMQEAMQTVQDACRYLEWSGERITIIDAGVDAEKAELICKLQEFDGTFDPHLHATKKGLQACTQLAEFMRKHTHSSLYVFQYLQHAVALPALPLCDTTENAEFADIHGGQQPPQPHTQLPQQQGGNLTWLPAPVPLARLAPELQASAAALIKADSSGTYAPFAVTKGYAPDFSHAPSGNGKQTPAAAEKAAQRKMPVASQIHALVTCQE
jgi:hypothetical protein